MKPPLSMIIGAATILLQGCVALPNGDTTAAFSGDRPALLSTMAKGSDAVLHVLILQPRGSSVGWNDSEFTIGFTKARVRIGWNHGAQKKELVFTYHGFTRELAIGATRWSTATGNTFVVALDDDWQPSVRPTSLRIGPSGAADVLAKLRTAFPDDTVLASLRSAMGS